MAVQWMKAQDTFMAQLRDGTQKFVVKGDPLPDNHELVIRDRDEAADAAKAGVDRPVLFRPLDLGEEAAAPKSVPEAADPEAAAPPVKTARKAG